jgi:phosphate transport system ATP-binding protein
MPPPRPPAIRTAVHDPIGLRPEPSAVSIRNLRAWYGPQLVIDIGSLDIPAYRITAIIGPSGSGKSTLLRCVNRLHEAIVGATVAGSVVIADQDIYAHGSKAALVRRHVGMVFQRPNPLPTRSIYDNVALGPRLLGVRGRDLDNLVERSLRQAYLWEEVKDRLKSPPAHLSGGQQQRLCIARTLAMEPAIILMDEPASALDPIATFRLEEVMHALKDAYTIVVVTHNMQQASRTSDYTALMLAGEDRIGHLVEFAPSAELFTHPHDPQTEAYISGRLG